MITGRLLSNASLCAVMMWLLLGDVVEEGRRPNIVLIMADDMGYGDISSLNADSTIQTPVLDRLIDEGRNFTEAHTSASVCTPTRYALLTGRYSFRTGLRGVLTGYSKPLIEYDRETVASLLKKAGYSTAVIGKWHLGLEWQPKDPSRPIFTKDGFMPNDLNVDYEAPVHGVEEVGFDYSFIVPGSNNIAPFTFVENGKVLLNPTDHVQPQIEGHTYRTRRNGGDKAPAFELDETLKVITGKSVEYLQEKARTKASPFFLYVPLTAPHFPWAPAEEFRGESKAGLYGDYIEEIDHRVGEILQVIDDQELDDDTLVIFTADNGGAAEPWFVERYGHQMNKGRRGQKQQIWEGGVRVPFIARWKGVVEGGSETDEPISLVDMLATCAGLTGEPVEPGYGEDSYDMSSLLVGEGGATVARGPMINQTGNPEALSITKDGWKLVPSGHGDSGVEPPRPGGSKGMLFHLHEDPMERQNVYDRYPRKVRELSRILEEYKRTGRSRPVEGSLVGHLIYGSLLGVVAGPPAPHAPAAVNLH